MSEPDHQVKALQRARERLVAHRRRLAGNLADEKLHGQTGSVAEEFRQFQAAIEAIDRAIEDEKWAVEQEAVRLELASRPKPEPQAYPAVEAMEDEDNPE